MKRNRKIDNYLLLLFPCHELLDMGNFIDKGSDGFSSVLNSNFVDKSLLIEEVNSVMLTENRYLCVTRAPFWKVCRGEDVECLLRSFL